MHCTAGRISLALAPPHPQTAVEAWNPNRWTAWEIPTTDIYYLTVFVGQKSSTGLKKCHQGCIVKEVLEGNALCPYLRCWPNLAPCGCRTEVPTSLLTIKWRLPLLLEASLGFACDLLYFRTSNSLSNPSHTWLSLTSPPAATFWLQTKKVLCC